MHKIFYFISICVFAVSGCHWFDDPYSIEECPLNSSYPCPCSTRCEGDHVCVHTQGDEKSYGQCTLPCDGDQQVCEAASNGFGGGVCLADGYCATACQSNDHCPAGMGCLQNICTPGLIIDPSVGRNDTASETDSDTDTIDTGDTGTLPLEQRQAECTTLCEKAFECFPDDQTYTLTELITACVDGNWHADECVQCRIACDATLACADWQTCNNACSACAQ